jgi:hypothetical protein
MNSRLKPEILEKLSKDFGLSKNTIRKEISFLREDFPGISLNAAAFLFARKRGKKIIRMLDANDRATLPNTKIVKKREVIKTSKTKSSKPKIKEIIDYSSSDYFIKEHIDEFHRAHHYKCYTAAYVLLRKIIENLIIDILKDKFPSKRKLYWNDANKRSLDFSVILDNLYKNRMEFKDKKNVIERLNQLLVPFKKDANNKTHSWFHIVKNSTEYNNGNLKTIIELIKKLQNI